MVYFNILILTYGLDCNLTSAHKIFMRKISARFHFSWCGGTFLGFTFIHCMMYVSVCVAVSCKDEILYGNYFPGDIFIVKRLNLSQPCALAFHIHNVITQMFNKTNDRLMEFWYNFPVWYLYREQRDLQAQQSGVCECINHCYKPDLD